MRKQPTEDKSLYDQIRAQWELWNNGNDSYLDPTISFDDFLVGYFACYYKDEPRMAPEALECFNDLIDEWENEDNDDSDIEMFSDLS